MTASVFNNGLRIPTKLQLNRVKLRQHIHIRLLALHMRNKYVPLYLITLRRYDLELGKMVRERKRARGWRTGEAMRQSLCQNRQVQRHLTKKACFNDCRKGKSYSHRRKIENLLKRPWSTHTQIIISNTGHLQAKMVRRHLVAWMFRLLEE